MGNRREFISSRRVEHDSKVVVGLTYATEIDFCTCGGLIEWISCPTGGWWAHMEHPADGHDAVGREVHDEVEEDW